MSLLLGGDGGVKDGACAADGGTVGGRILRCWSSISVKFGGCGCDEAPTTVRVYAGALVALGLVSPKNSASSSFAAEIHSFGVPSVWGADEEEVEGVCDGERNDRWAAVQV